MKPKLTLWLVIRTGGFLALFFYGAYTVFRTPGGTFWMKAIMGLLFGILCLETILPLLRALPIVSERMDFLLAGIQYVGVPALALMFLAFFLWRTISTGKLDARSGIKAIGSGLALVAMICSFLLPTWKKYQADRRKTRGEKLRELEAAYRSGTMSREEYQDKREAIYESMWKTEKQD